MRLSLYGTPAYTVPAFPDLLVGADFGESYTRVTTRRTPRLGYVDVLLLAVTVFFFIFSLSTFLLSMPSRMVITKNTVDAAAAPGKKIFQSLTSFSTPPPLELHIASNGFIFIHSVKVLSIQGTTLTVGAVWGSTDYTYTVHTDSSTYESHDYGTSFLNKEGGRISLADVQSGDLVSVTGMLDSTQKEPTLNADVVRSLK